MINRNELQRRDFPVVMDGVQFLTTRTATIVEGDTHYIFLGYAHPGSSEVDPVWMIQRVAMFSDDSTTTVFAGGQALFNQVWADRTSLTFS